MLIVVLGGEKDLAKLTVGYNKKTDSFSNSINAAKDIIKDVTGITVPNNVFGDLTQASLPDPSQEEVTLTFIRLAQVNMKLKPPYDLKLIIPDQADAISYSVHELNRILLTFGFSMKYVDQRIFTASGSNVTAVDPKNGIDESIKGGLYLMLDYALKKRDLDKITDKNPSLPSSQRWSAVLGVKLSTDPLQSIIVGLGYALNRDIRIIFGPSLESLPISGAILNAGNLSSSYDYIYQNIDRKYEVRGFIGLSLSPGSISSIFNSSKK